MDVRTEGCDCGIDALSSCFEHTDQRACEAIRANRIALPNAHLKNVRLYETADLYVDYGGER